MSETRHCPATACAEFGRSLNPVNATCRGEYSNVFREVHRYSVQSHLRFTREKQKVPSVVTDGTHEIIEWKFALPLQHRMLTHEGNFAR